MKGPIGRGRMERKGLMVKGSRCNLLFRAWYGKEGRKRENKGTEICWTVR